MQFFPEGTDSADHSGKHRTILLRKIEPEDWNRTFGPLYLHDKSQLRATGEEFVLSWDFFDDEMGIPERALPALAAGLTALGHCTFSHMAPWWYPPWMLEDVGIEMDSPPPCAALIASGMKYMPHFVRRLLLAFGVVPFTLPHRADTTWLIKTPFLHRALAFFLGDRGFTDRYVRVICTRNPLTVNVLQLACWGMRGEGAIIVTEEPLNEAIWEWEQEEQFVFGLLDDRSGAVSKRRPLAIVIPGYDADYLWVWCRRSHCESLKQVLREASAADGLQFRLVNAQGLIDNLG